MMKLKINKTLTRKKNINQKNKNRIVKIIHEKL
jgi:hypothetical protein